VGWEGEKGGITREMEVQGGGSSSMEVRSRRGGSRTDRRGRGGGQVTHSGRSTTRYTARACGERDGDDDHVSGVAAWENGLVSAKERTTDRRRLRRMPGGARRCGRQRMSRGSRLSQDNRPWVRFECIRELAPHACSPLKSRPMAVQLPPTWLGTHNARARSPVPSRHRGGPFPSLSHLIHLRRGGVALVANLPTFVTLLRRCSESPDRDRGARYSSCAQHIQPSERDRHACLVLSARPVQAADV